MHGLPRCADCNILISKGRKRCRKCCFKGKNNPNWNGGISKLPYSFRFSNELKEKIRKRDNFICQHCGLKEENHFRGKKKINLTIHHIDYNKENCEDNNLIALCNPCNTRANSNRDYWFAHYSYLIKEIVHG